MIIYQAIETRYLGPTNYRGSRVVATTPFAGLRHVHQWDCSLDIDGNHHAAAEALRAKLDWPTIVAGGTTKSGYVWVTSTLDA